ncbi:MAG: redox-sensing transcriptional repressor Rex [Clostridia bacterium]|nr:redox-sensing transcriptional repressor Rex [Clostridia bacterium]
MENQNNFFRSENKISSLVIKRLPKYYRILTEQQAKGELKISSSQLARLSGTTASQIRQDFSLFGGFGQQGFGYNIEFLLGEIKRIIGVDKQHKAILIGVGNLGKALIHHMNFESSGFSLIGAFDSSDDIIDKTVGEIKIRSIDEVKSFCRINKVHTAIICIPNDEAEKVVEELYEANVYNFWNFSDYNIKMNYPDVNVETVKLRDSLMCLCYLATNE